MGSVFHNKIAKICLEYFNSLRKTGKPKASKWTVLSCIVQEYNSHLEVVALGTGSKCIGKNKLSGRGDILNDSHAEIIYRRAFIRYLYEQIKWCSENQSDICVYDAAVRKFKLQNVKFHFFTTHVPCGDAAIFLKESSIDNIGSIISSKVENSSTEKREKRLSESESEQPHKKTKTEDIYRTGAKCLTEDLQQDPMLGGLGYHITGVVRTKPGRGDPTLSVSCSDKISRWCHVGIQGALLSLLLSEPVYIGSFTVTGGTTFCEEAFNRAVFSRISSPELVKPYHTVKLQVGQAEQNFAYSKENDKVPSAASILWWKSKPERHTEVSVDGKKQGVTKKHINTAAARLSICKVELFKLFIQIIETFPLDITDKNELKTMCYYDAKQLAIEYQHSWQNLKQAFKVWTKKDRSLSMFCTQ